MRVKRGLPSATVAQETADFRRGHEGREAERAKEDSITSSTGATRCSHWSTPFAAYTGLWSLHPRGFGTLTSSQCVRKNVDIPFSSVSTSFPSFLFFVCKHVYPFAFSNNVCPLFRLSIELIRFDRSRSVAGLFRRAIALENAFASFLHPFPSLDLNDIGTSTCFKHVETNTVFVLPA